MKSGKMTVSGLNVNHPIIPAAMRCERCGYTGGLYSRHDCCSTGVTCSYCDEPAIGYWFTRHPDPGQPGIVAWCEDHADEQVER